MKTLFKTILTLSVMTLILSLNSCGGGSEDDYKNQTGTTTNTSTSGTDTTTTTTTGGTETTTTTTTSTETTTSTTTSGGTDTTTTSGECVKGSDNNCEQEVEFTCPEEKKTDEPPVIWVDFFAPIPHSIVEFGSETQVVFHVDGSFEEATLAFKINGTKIDLKKTGGLYYSGTLSKRAEIKFVNSYQIVTAMGLKNNFDNELTLDVEGCGGKADTEKLILGMWMPNWETIKKQNQYDHLVP